MDLYIVDDEKFIKIVKEYPEIYNKSDSRYKLPQLKCEAWKEISKRLGVEESKCMRRWKTLREHYVRLLRISESSPGSVNTSGTWDYFEAMSFLKKNIRTKRLRLETSNDSLGDTKSFRRVLNIPDPLAETRTSFDELLDIELCKEKDNSYDAQCVHEERSETPRKKYKICPIERAAIETAEIFKKVCAARLEEKAKSRAVAGFMTMLGDIMENLSPNKQAEAIERITVLAMSIKNRPE